MDGKKNKKDKIDLDNLKIITTPQYLGLIVGFVFTIGITYGTFQSMNSDLKDLKKTSQENKTSLDKRIQELQKDINKNLIEIKEKNANMSGQLEVISKHLTK